MENIELIPLPLKKDDRGWIITPPMINDFANAFVHIPSLKPQAVRGNHYHQNHTEAVVILGGKCLVATKNRENDHYEEFIYDGIIKQLIVIKPNISHAFKNIFFRSIYLFCYAQGPKDLQVTSIGDPILK